MSAPLPVVTAALEWNRIIQTSKAQRVDAPSPHSPAYFTAYPHLRDQDGDFCYLCTPEKRPAEARSNKDKAKATVSQVGTLQGLAIYDVLYFFDNAEKPDWKSILAEPSQLELIFGQIRQEGPDNFFPVSKRVPELLVVETYPLFRRG